MIILIDTTTQFALWRKQKCIQCFLIPIFSDIPISATFKEVITFNRKKLNFLYLSHQNKKNLI